MTVEQLVILAIVGAAFVAGWVARDPKGHPSRPAPEPDADALPALDAASAAYMAAADAWADGEDTAAARARLDECLAALHAAAGVTPASSLADAITALESAAAVIATSRHGRPLDRSTSSVLDALEDDLSNALEALGAARLD